MKGQLSDVGRDALARVVARFVAPNRRERVEYEATRRPAALARRLAHPEVGLFVGLSSVERGAVPVDGPCVALGISGGWATHPALASAIAASGGCGLLAFSVDGGWCYVEDEGEPPRAWFGR